MHRYRTEKWLNLVVTIFETDRMRSFFLGNAVPALVEFQLFYLNCPEIQPVIQEALTFQTYLMRGIFDLQLNC
jgi:hypothetical protein